MAGLLTEPRQSTEGLLIPAGAFPQLGADMRSKDEWPHGAMAMAHLNSTFAEFFVPRQA